MLRSHCNCMQRCNYWFGRHEPVQSDTSLPGLMALRYAHLVPEKLGAVASRIERQPLTGLTSEPHGINVANAATFSLRSVN